MTQQVHTSVFILPYELEGTLASNAINGDSWTNRVAVLVGWDTDLCSVDLLVSILLYGISTFVHSKVVSKISFFFLVQDRRNRNVNAVKTH